MAVRTSFTPMECSIPAQGESEPPRKVEPHPAAGFCLFQLWSRISTKVSTCLHYSSSSNTNSNARTFKIKISDTLRRHIQKQHKTIEPLNRARRACAGCHAGKTRCEGGVPCQECVRRKAQCSFQGYAASLAEEQKARPWTSSSSSLNHGQSWLYYRREQRKQWVDRYFEIFHPCWPFIHKGSFDGRRETPLLLQSVMAIGMWTSGEQSTQSAAVELHGLLDSAIRDQRLCQFANLLCIMYMMY